MRRSLAAAAVLTLASPAHASAPTAPGERLAMAIEIADIDGVRGALKAKADPNRPGLYGASPLLRAVSKQNPSLVAALLAARAKPDSADAAGLTPLTLACELGNEDIVLQLIAAGADLRRPAPDGSAPLAVCARFASAATVSQMLAKGAPANSVDPRGLTPLMWAASSGNVEAARELLRAGADANSVTEAGFSPLFFAIRSGVPEATRLLLEAEADAAHRGPENTSALQLALYQSNFAAAAMLLPLGFDLAERDREGLQPLHRAAAGGASDLVPALIAAGADANAVTGPSKIKWVTEANFGMPPPPVPPTPPLFLAAQHGHAEAMRRLVAAGADPHFVPEDGADLVTAAVRGGSTEALEFALERIPDPNHANAKGMTALHVLLFGGLQDELEPMLTLLKSHGARTDIAMAGGATAAEIAAKGLTEVRVIFERVFPEAKLPLQSAEE
ncbi:ankyrin repeat domain-containing protein [Novosphingobium aquimarinum]|uniref:ankyrin repeat domain-containing protein n=1 Tax=Novosphingobium aquimarinum TaxID=2682494 RepID=UPI0018DDE910|nr:ankyrin repeat domain-containing protein [Novosphingobium aquimarinum]